MFKRTIVSLSLTILALVAQASIGNAKLEGARLTDLPEQMG